MWIWVSRWGESGRSGGGELPCKQNMLYEKNQLSRKEINGASASCTFWLRDGGEITLQGEMKQTKVPQMWHYSYVPWSKGE